MKRKLIAMCAAIGVFANFVGCAEKTETDATTESTAPTYDDYSHGLDDKGFYLNIEENRKALPDFSEWKVTGDEVLEWGCSNYYSFGSVEEGVTTYTEAYLTQGGYNLTDIAQEDDIVTLNAVFTFADESTLEETIETYAKSEGSEIQKAVMGAKANDTGESVYIFSEEAEEHAGEEASISYTVESVVLGNPATEENIEKHKEEIEADLETEINSVEELESALKPFFAAGLLTEYLATRLQVVDLDVPEVYTEYEVYRLHARLKQVGVDWDDYLAQLELTEEDVRVECEKLARENYITMQYALVNEIEISEEDLNNYYGEELSAYEDVQGRPYLLLNRLRVQVVAEIATTVQKDGIFQ